MFIQIFSHLNTGQGLTGVRDQFRGKKLGKWVKSALLLYTKENFPKVELVTTGNAESNAPMLYINQKLGFKKHKENLVANLTLSALKDYLELKQAKTIPLIS